MGRSSRRSRGDKPTAEIPTVQLEIDSLDLEANGVARAEGKVVFVRGALPNELVTAQIVRSKSKFDVANTVSIERQSYARVTPKCPHFGVCGGCSMQHFEISHQLATKQRALEDQLLHISKLKAETFLRPLSGPDWGYRYRGRLSVRNVIKKGKLLVGFHEKGSSYVADMTQCMVLPKHLSDLLMPLRDLVSALSIRDRMPQIEFAVGDKVTGLVFRVMDPPTVADEALLLAFAAEHSGKSKVGGEIEIWLQHKGPDTIYLLGTKPASDLAYELPEFRVRMPFKPTDFTQVNHQVNEALVSRALRLLDVQPTDRVLDLFCGLGNFTLPLATQAKEVVGIEGSAALISRALDNAKTNGLAEKLSFQVANLFEFTQKSFDELGCFDRVLIDPPREGAMELCKVFAENALLGVKAKRIVYVSCNPATLARDAGILVAEGGYKLSKAGVVNMFPHTSHVESMAVFDATD
jgi:23S rRNA (uracil1939-C5)-methyltransferase